MKKICCVLPIILLSLILFPVKSFSETDLYIEERDLDISTSPYEVFFNVSNLKPGDKISKVLTVSNSGIQDFNYIFTNKFITGSQKFYNELQLHVEGKEGSIFKGYLKDFEKLDPRSLNSGLSEELVFTVEIPYELGNEFQGLGSEFQFKLYVEGTLGGVLPVDNRLPVTATEVLNFILIGVALLATGTILFIYNKRKKKDSSTLKEKIIGP